MVLCFCRLMMVLSLCRLMMVLSLCRLMTVLSTCRLMMVLSLYRLMMVLSFCRLMTVLCFCAVEDPIQQQLNTTAEMIRDLQHSQDTRLSQTPPSHLAHCPGPSDREVELGQLHIPDLAV